ncbi:MAG: NB-ARC domain-containing protein, partial [Cyanobacteria bacterium J06632_22]
MGSDRAIEFTDALLYEHTGQHLSDLQYCILQHPSKTYRAIATLAGYSEGHVKDVAAQLWRVLSEVLGERITKGNYRSRLKYWLKRAKHKVVNKLATVSQPPVAVAVPAVQVDRAVPAPHFLGRQAACDTLDTLVAQHRLVVIQGEGGLGKTTLAQTYLNTLGCSRVLELMMAKEAVNISPVERVVEEWLRQDFDEEPGLDFGVTLDRLRRHLRREQIGILIDNFEPALDAHGQLVGHHRRYVELLRVLADPAVQSVTLVTSRDRICEPGIRAYHYRLPGLSQETWQQFFAAHGVSLGSASHGSPSPLMRLHRTYGGNAKAMEILCCTVQSDYDGDLASYGQVNGPEALVEMDLQNLIDSQVDRIQQLDPSAYQLLCRLGCYRFQTVTQLPLAALTVQLPAVPASQRHQAIASLRNRSLLETQKGRYWLHPAVQAVVVDRLTDDARRDAHRSAAQYWLEQRQQITTLPEALQALEAFYHYRSIGDDAAAAGVLLRSYHNQWQQYLPLASHLYRMGLLQPIVEAIGEVLPRLQDSDQTCELYNILGDVHWIKGEIGAAIACQQRTLATTAKLLAASASFSPAASDPSEGPSGAVRRQYYLKMLNIDSHLSIGFYTLDRWELAAAKAGFERVIQLAEGT